MTGGTTKLNGKVKPSSAIAGNFLLAMLLLDTVGKIRMAWFAKVAGGAEVR